MGCALPAVGNLRQLRAGVVPRHLCWCWKLEQSVARRVGRRGREVGNGKLIITEIKKQIQGIQKYLNVKFSCMMHI